MGKMSELDLCIGELRNAAQSLVVAADSLTALFGGGSTESEDLKSSITSSEYRTVQESKPLTLEQVRAVLAEKSRSGHTAEVRILLEAHGAAKLSEIDPARYPALLEEASRVGLTEVDNG